MVLDDIMIIRESRKSREVVALRPSQSKTKKHNMQKSIKNDGITYNFNNTLHTKPINPRFFYHDNTT